MRVQPALLSVGLVGSLCEAARAPVYVSGPAAQAAAPAALTYGEARLYFAQRLGLSQEYDLNGASDAAIDLFNQASDAQAPLFGAPSGQHGRRRTLVIVEGIEAPDSLFDSRTPAFHIDSRFSLGDNYRMVSTFLSQDQEKRESRESCGSLIRTTDIKDSIQGGFSAADPLGQCDLDQVHNSDWWQSLAFKEKLAFLGASSSDIMNKAFDKAAPAWMADDMTGVFHVWTLQEVGATHGTSSAAYQDALKDVRSALGSLLSGSSDVTVVVMPYDKAAPNAKRGISHAAAKHQAARRQADPAATGLPNGLPKTTIPMCYSAQSACEAATANCSGHGACSLRWTESDSGEEKGAECWACVCVATVLVEPDADGHGGRTVSWGGPACQKKDVTVPFWLFAGFGVAAASGIAYGIGMLYSVGQAELPGVLGAGVASVGARAK